MQSSYIVNKKVPPNLSKDNELVRYGTFLTFPNTNKPWALRLSQAGFYYTKVGDQVFCFSCGLSISNWSPDDDPVTVHKRESPACNFIKTAFAESAEKDTERDTERCSKANTRGDDMSEANTTNRDHDACAVGATGYSPSRQVKSTERDIYRDKKQPRMGLLGGTPEYSMANQDNQGHRQLKRQNEELKLMTYCSQCKENEVCIVFLPCGHLVTCENCAPTLRNCNMCHVFIKGTVRTYRS